MFTGFSADLTYKISRDKFKLRGELDAGLTGAIMSFVYFMTALIAVSTFNIGDAPLNWTNSGTFTGLAYFSVPWMLINAFFGGLAVYGFHILHPKHI